MKTLAPRLNDRCGTYVSNVSFSPSNRSVTEKTCIPHIGQDNELGAMNSGFVSSRFAVRLVTRSTDKSATPSVRVAKPGILKKLRPSGVEFRIGIGTAIPRTYTQISQEPGAMLRNVSTLSSKARLRRS